MKKIYSVFSLHKTVLALCIRFRVQMMHLLGEGAFGCVYYAELKPPASEDSSTTTPIAVKMLKGNNLSLYCCLFFLILNLYSLWFRIWSHS